MKLLLDTHAFLWFVAGDAQLSAKARRRIEDARNESFISVATVWEIAIKVGLGKLRLQDSLSETLEWGTRDNRIALLPVSKAHAIAVSVLPDHHRDPFDRMLVVQARAEEMAVVTRDAVFDAYAVRRIW